MTRARVFTVAPTRAAALLISLVVGAGGAVSRAAEPAADGERTSRISDDAVQRLDVENFPQRPKPIVELGNPFLGTGNIEPGIELPGGAVFQPSLLVFGTYRTAVQAFHDGDTTSSEWANRLDVFANLQLSGTERILAGFRPLDEDGRFSGYLFEPESEWEEEFDGELQTLFFEGDIGELLPNLDPYDSKKLDWGFSVGRQPISLQDGMLIDDDLDAVGITRNSILPPGGTNLQLTFLYAWNEVHRDNNVDLNDNDLFAFSAVADYPFSTMQFDVVYVNDRTGDEGDNDGVFWGASGVQRIGHLNTTFRVLGSHALEDENAAVSTGYLLFSEVSWTPPWTHDLMYVNAFWGIDEFASAARGPEFGGPLGRVGILFAAVGLGRYGAALGNRADESVGGAIGYQMFLDETRRQLIFEVGARDGTEGDSDATLAGGVRFQQALGQQWVLQLDAFGGLQESRDDSWGGRVEMRYEF